MLSGRGNSSRNGLAHARWLFPYQAQSNEIILQYAIIPTYPDSREGAIEALTELGARLLAEFGVVVDTLAARV